MFRHPLAAAVFRVRLVASRCARCRGPVVAGVLLCGVLGVGVVADAMAQRSGQSGTASSSEFRLGDWVKIVKMDGRELTGKLVEADRSSISIEVAFGSMAQTLRIERFDIDTVEQVEAPQGACGDGDGEREADRDAGDEPSSGGFVIAPLKGEVGRELTGQFLERLIMLADRKEAEVIILHIESPGGFISSLDRMLEVLESERDVKIVAYTDDDCFSAAAIFAMACDEFWVGPGAAVGAAVLWSAGEDGRPSAVDAKFASAQAASWRAQVEKMGRPGELVDAMVLQDVELWADKSTTPWTLYREEPRGEARDRVERLDSKDAVLTLTAKDLVNTGAAQGSAGSIAELIVRLRLEEPNHEALDGAREFSRHASAVERSLEDVEEAIEEYDEIIEMFGGENEDAASLTRSDVRRAVRELRSKMKRLEQLAERYEHVQAVVDEDVVEDWIEQLEDLLEDLRG